jgi:hypothetical protein
MRDPRRIWSAAAIALLVTVGALGCSSDDDGDDDGASDTTGTPTETTAESSSTSEGDDQSTGEAAELAESSTSFVLNETYGSGEPVVAVDTVTVHWYQADGNYVAVYTGEGLADLPPVCPGNSLSLPDGTTFDHISNAPSQDGGCEGIDSTITELRNCETAWIHPTAIPVDSEGVLYASISSPDTTAGVLGFTVVDPEVPEIDLDASSYTVSDGLLADGVTELAC